MDEKEKLEKLKFSLTLEQVESLLSELGGNPQRYNNMIISKTICHCGESHKLFYYDNTKLFRCYTECSDTFDIYQLVMKVQSYVGNKLALPQAYNYIAKFFNIIDVTNDFPDEKDKLKDWQILDKYDKNSSQDKEEKQIVELKHYDKKILKYLPAPRILPWEEEGITREAISHHGIRYNPSSQAIVIPDYDGDGNLVGIRERTLIKENEKYGKYRPAILNHQMYNHPLGFNLYNLLYSKPFIKDMKKVIVFEGEKSPLLYESYFGMENDISVACCGSNFSSYQVKLLLDLGVEEIIIAFDKQFKELGDEEHKGWVKKLKDINNKYSKQVKISFMFDKWGLLNYKDSPIDDGPEKFLELFKKRIIL